MNKDRVLTALRGTEARGLSFMAEWNSGDRYAVCHHATRWDHLKIDVSLKWAPIAAVDMSPTYQF